MSLNNSFRFYINNILLLFFPYFFLLEVLNEGHPRFRRTTEDHRLWGHVLSNDRAKAHNGFLPNYDPCFKHRACTDDCPVHHLHPYHLRRHWVGIVSEYDPWTDEYVVSDHSEWWDVGGTLDLAAPTDLHIIIYMD